MKLMAKAGAALPFAHLLGMSKSAKVAEDEEDKRVESQDDEDKAQKAEGDDIGEGDDEGDDKKKDAKSKSTKAEDDQPDEDKKEDDDEEGDDDSDGGDMAKGKKARSARLRERARCSAIFNDPAAGKNPTLAATLAFTTDLSRSAAITVLRAGGAAVAPKRSSLDNRMAAVTRPNVGADAEAQPVTKGSAIVAAAKKARGEA